MVYVSPGGSTNTSECGDIDLPCDALAAVYTLRENSTVRFLPGVYSISSTFLVCRTNGVSLFGFDPNKNDTIPEPGAVSIDCNDRGFRAVEFLNSNRGSIHHITIQNCTLIYKNLKDDLYFGGAALSSYCEFPDICQTSANLANLTDPSNYLFSIRNCQFFNNSVISTQDYYATGGAVSLYGPSLVEDSLFQFNRAHYSILRNLPNVYHLWNFAQGGALAIQPLFFQFNLPVVVRRTKIVSNVAQGSSFHGESAVGGGLFVEGSGWVEMSDCLIKDNSLSDSMPSNYYEPIGGGLWGAGKRTKWNLI